MTLQIKGKSVTKYGNYRSATGFIEVKRFHSWYIVKQTEQQENLYKNLIPGTETPAAIVPAAITAAVVYAFSLHPK